MEINGEEKNSQRKHNHIIMNTLSLITTELSTGEGVIQIAELPSDIPSLWVIIDGVYIII